MGFTEVLTLVLVVLNATHYIHISWWLAFLPEIVAVGIYIVMFLIFSVLGVHVLRKSAR